MADDLQLPPDTPALRKPGRRRRGRCCLIALFALGGVCYGAVVFVVPPYPWKGWLPGPVRTAPEWHPRPTAQNGRDDCEPVRESAAIDHADAEVLNRWTRAVLAAEPESAGALPGEARAYRLLDDRAKVLAALHSAADKPWSSGEAPGWDPPPSYIPLARVAADWALRLHCEGRGEEALRVLEDCAALGANLACGESLWQVFGGANCASISRRAALHVIVDADLPEGALREHMLRLRELRGRVSGLPESLAWQNAAAERVISEVAHGRVPAEIEHYVGDEAWIRAVIVAYTRAKRGTSLAWTSDRTARLIEEASKPEGESDLPGAMEQAERDMASRRDCISGMQMVVAVGWRAYGLLRLHLLAQETVCALELFRREHGDYPASLADLAPAHLPAEPVDPHMGGPLGYRREGEGYVLYAVGTDGKDDGGVLDPQASFAPDLLLAGSGVEAEARRSQSGWGLEHPEEGEESVY